MEHLTREQAVERGLLRFFTGDPCKNGHVAERYVKKGICIQCNRQNALRNYYDNTDAAKAKMAEWLEKNRDRKLAMDREWYAKNRTKVRAAARAARDDGVRAKEREYRRKRIKSDPVFALACRVRSQISTSLTDRYWAKHKGAQQILGCTFDEFKAHIERQFLRGMSWENRGDWHIDHIVPVSSANTRDELLALFHFTNLRPLWAKENIAKLNRITHLI